MKRLNTLLLLLIGLTACQPKGSLLYQYPNTESLDINELVVVIDYLNLKDDLGNYWDFDSQHHKTILNQKLTAVNRLTVEAGYPKISNYVLSSGLLVKPDFAVEHYQTKQLQAGLLYPPYVLAAEKTSSQLIDQHQEIMNLLVKYIAQRRYRETDEYTHRGMQMAYHFDAMDLPPNTGILYIHIDLSAPGIIKQTGTFLLAGAAASQADYAQINFAATPRRQASAFLLHKASGQILWKNHSKTWRPDQPISTLLLNLPLLVKP